MVPDKAKDEDRSEDDLYSDATSRALNQPKKYDKNVARRDNQAVLTYYAYQQSRGMA